MKVLLIEMLSLVVVCDGIDNESSLSTAPTAILVYVFYHPQVLYLCPCCCSAWRIR